MSESFTAHHVLEYPGGYTPARWDRWWAATSRVCGTAASKASGWRTAAFVPPTEYDPTTSVSVPPDGDHWVTLGPAGRVQSWTWVAEPRPGKHALSKPFVFVLIRPDGADTAMLHIVDCGSPDAIAVSLRVAPRWRTERTGNVTDIEAWVPLADGEEPQAAPLRVPEEDDQPVTGILAPVHLEYDVNVGEATSCDLRGLGEGRIIGGRAPSSNEVYAASCWHRPEDG